MDPRTKTRDITPWFGRRSAAKAADPRPMVGPRIDFRRVAPSRLPEVSFAYKNPCIGPERGSFRFYARVFMF